MNIDDIGEYRCDHGGDWRINVLIKLSEAFAMPSSRFHPVLVAMTTTPKAIDSDVRMNDIEMRIVIHGIQKSGCQHSQPSTF